jgi:hypothetical protein
MSAADMQIGAPSSTIEMRDWLLIGSFMSGIRISV